MSDGGVRLGRRWAHGRRFVAVDERREVGEVLAALGERAEAARSLLSRALRATGERGVRVRPAESDVAALLGRAGVVRLEEKVEGTAASPRWVPWRVAIPPEAERDVATALGRVDAGAERVALIAEIDGATIVAGESALLREEPTDVRLRPPSGSACPDVPWSVYAAALRAAAEWERMVAAGDRPSPRELAARALGSSKAWTSARRDAFARLVGQPFDVALTRHERFVRLTGPVRWRYGNVEGDGRAATPWIGLPGSTIKRLEIITCHADHVLVIENLETFEEVVRGTRLESTVVVYGAGYASDDVIDLLQKLRREVVAWCDLDPHGIRIVADLERRLGRPVRTVGMSAGLLNSPYAQKASDEQRAEAQELRTSGPPTLRGLASAIHERGLVCEQEALQQEVMRDLGDQL